MMRKILLSAMVISVLVTGNSCTLDEPDPRVEMTLFEYLTAGNGQWLMIDRESNPSVLYTFRKDSTYDEYQYAHNLSLTDKKFEAGGPHSIERGTYLGGNATLSFYYTGDDRYYIFGVWWSEDADEMMWRDDGGMAYVVMRQKNDNP